MFNRHISVTIWPVEKKCVTKMLTQKAKVGSQECKSVLLEPTLGFFFPL